MAAYDVLRRVITISDCWGYKTGAGCASEPAAWAAMALAMWDAPDAARRPADWLLSIQQQDGSVGISEDHARPAWPTSLAMLAWWTLRERLGDDQYSEAIERATAWALQEEGKPAPQQAHIGHDTTLVGWSWAADTHSWLEPTSFFVMALRALGLADQPRTREGVRLVADRILPSGGCNYGNTLVLGQELLPHVQPTGIAMLALAGTGANRNGPNRNGIGASLDYLTDSLDSKTSRVSLCYGLMGLEAHGRRPAQADAWLEKRAVAGPLVVRSCYEASLTLLAASGFATWLTEHWSSTTAVASQ